MSSELKTTRARVLAILEQDERARNSDSFLYLRVIGMIAEEKGIDLDRMTVPDFLLNMNTIPVPPFESVRRTRQMVQREFPELSANETVEGFRDAKETEFREFVRGGA